ncbi:hypothetical protein CFC21_019219, partial [Triticum aestivum]
EINDDR